MKRLASIGECMLEFSEAKAEQFRLGFAGDTYNVAVYCQRSVSREKLQVDYVTAMGDDPFSQQMLQSMKNEQLGTDLISVCQGRLSGLYLIKTDQHGERNFYFYRSQSPARDLFHGEEGKALLKKLSRYDVIYLSGITLAILHPDSRERLFEFLAEAHRAGKEIIFDNNYRARLWSSIDETRDAYRRVYQYVTLALPSFEDAVTLFQDSSVEATAERLLSAGVREMVIKQGEKGYYLVNPNERLFVSIRPVTNVVDTTAAGDSFNGGYLAKRLTGQTPAVAAAYAAELAALVIQHPGAIIPREAMQ